MSPELQELCEACVTQWQESVTNKQKSDLEELIRNAFEYNMDRLMGQFIAARYRGDLEKIADSVFKKWITEGQFEGYEPTEETRRTVSDVMRGMSLDDKRMTRITARRLQLAAYKMQAQGVPPRAIAQELGIKLHNVSGMVKAAKNHAKELMDELVEYTVTFSNGETEKK